MSKHNPDLIPDSSRVNLDKIIPPVEPPKKKKHWTYGIAILASILALSGFAATVSDKPWVAVILLLFAVFVHPAFQNKMETSLRFKMTWLFKTVLLFILLGSASGIFLHYTIVERNKAALELAEADKKAEKEKKEQIAKEQVQKQIAAKVDSFKTESDQQYKKGNSKAALSLLDSAIAYSSGDEKNNLLRKKADDQYSSGQYVAAIDGYTILLNDGVDRDDNYYNRALCYDRTGQRQRAVDDLKDAIDLGSQQAQKMYDQINPVQKRVSYYITRCCDGTTSSAKGRGACSHHGGVCNWNEPVYEEYRQY